jgi:hypothetical protein
MFGSLAVWNAENPTVVHGVMVVVLLALMITVLAGYDADDKKTQEDAVRAGGWLLLVPIVVSAVLLVGSCCGQYKRDVRVTRTRPEEVLGYYY